MERAPAPQIRASLEAAKTLGDSGFRFVPVPVVDEEDHAKWVALMWEQMEKIEKLV